MHEIKIIKKKVAALFIAAWLVPAISGCGSPAPSESQAATMTENQGESTATITGNQEIPITKTANLTTTAAGDEEEHEETMLSVNITVGDKVFAAKFYDNESARTIVSHMPFTLEMGDYASQEKVIGLPFALPLASTVTPATINTGDIYLWSGSSMVLFYTTFANSYSYVPVGYIVDTAGLTDALGSSRVTVEFAAVVAEASAPDHASASWKAEAAQLAAEKHRLYAEYTRLKEEVRDDEGIRRCVEQIMHDVPDKKIKRTYEVEQ